MERIWVRVCFASLAFLVVEATPFGQDRQETSPFMTLEISRTEVPLSLGLTVRDAEAEFLINLDPHTVADAPEVLLLDLYKGVRLEARRFKTRVYNEGMSWSGHLYFPDILGPDVITGERDNYEADIVVLFLPDWDDNYCGRANLRFYHD